VTTSGYFGLGPAAMKDPRILYYILFNATVPFILKRVEGGVTVWWEK